MTQVIQMLPNLILYIVVGFFFDFTFELVALKKNSNNTEHIIIKSLIIGYVYCNLAYSIPITINRYIDNALILITAIIMAYMLARFYRSEHKVELFDFLKIPDTGNEYMWDDLLDDTWPMRISIIYNEYTYDGFLHATQSYSYSPQVAVALYKVTDKKGRIIKNYSDDERRIMIFDVSKADYIELVYDEESRIASDIRKFKGYEQKASEN